MFFSENKGQKQVYINFEQYYFKTVKFTKNKIFMKKIIAFHKNTQNPESACFQGLQGFSKNQKNSKTPSKPHALGILAIFNKLRFFQKKYLTKIRFGYIMQLKVKESQSQNISLYVEYPK